MPDLSNNKKAYYDFEILDKIEAGLVLTGPEVKSAKAGQIDLKGSYVSLTSEGEAYLTKAHIAHYRPAATYQRDYDPDQNRKLLLKKRDLERLIGKSVEAGTTIIPLRAYIKNGYIKVEIAVARGKKKHDKRESIKKRDFERRKKQLLND